jgi:hypothetical protein
VIKIVVVIALLSMLQGSTVAQKQKGSNGDHWVSTWATAQELAPTVRDVVEIPPEVPRPDFGRRGNAPVTDSSFASQPDDSNGCSHEHWRN